MRQDLDNVSTLVEISVLSLLLVHGCEEEEKNQNRTNYAQNLSNSAIVALSFKTLKHQPSGLTSALTP